MGKKDLKVKKAKAEESSDEEMKVEKKDTPKKTKEEPKATPAKDKKTPVKKEPTKEKKPAKNEDSEEEDSDDSSSEETKTPIKADKKGKKTEEPKGKKVEEQKKGKKAEEPKKADPKAKKAEEAKGKKAEESKKGKGKKAGSDEESDSDDDSSEESEVEKKTKKNDKMKVDESKKRKPDTDASAETETKKSKKNEQAKPATKKKESSDEESDDDDDEEEEKKEKKEENGKSAKKTETPAPAPSPAPFGKKDGKKIVFDSDGSAVESVKEQNKSGSGSFTVYACNLPWKITENDLKEYFPGSTNMEFLNEDSGRFSGNVKVEFSSADDFNAAFEKDGGDVWGRRMKVSMDPPQAPAPGKGGRGKGTKSGFTVFLGRCPDEIEDNDVYELFKDAGGDVTGIRWLFDKETGEFRRCGFVDFSTKEAADNAIIIGQTATVKGRSIRVDQTNS